MALKIAKKNPWNKQLYLHNFISGIRLSAPFFFYNSYAKSLIMVWNFPVTSLANSFKWTNIDRNFSFIFIKSWNGYKFHKIFFNIVFLLWICKKFLHLLHSKWILLYISRKKWAHFFLAALLVYNEWKL